MTNARRREEGSVFRPVYDVEGERVAVGVRGH
jgi:hypothetical protein